MTLNRVIPYTGVFKHASMYASKTNFMFNPPNGSSGISQITPFEADADTGDFL